MKSILGKIKRVYWRYLMEKKVDRYFVSFPKSGRTWVRFILAEYFLPGSEAKDDLNFFNLHKQNKNIPWIIFTHLNYRNKAIKTKSRGDLFKGKRAIFLVRDPRDIAVSYYHHLTKRDKTYEGGVSDFIRDEKYGLEAIIEYLNKTLDRLRKNCQSYAIIRYEDLKNDTLGSMVKIFEFYGLQADKERLARAIEAASFDNMKKLEQAGDVSDKRLKPGDKNDQESFKVRKGRVGGYKEELTAEDIKYVDEKMRLLNEELRYRF